MMLNISLPDGSVRAFESPVNGFQIAESIGTGLLKAAIAMTVNGTQKDLSTEITTDSTVSIITTKTEEGLEIMRHTFAAQVLARALKTRYPSAKLAIGPTIENGFYYDIETSSDKIGEEDLTLIEKEMAKIISEGHAIKRVEYTREDAISLFKHLDEPYKIEIIQDAPESETHFGIYEQGDGVFYDLCRGPHLPSLEKIKKAAFKLQKVSGAYWRGDSNNTMLTRIYGTAFNDKKELKNHLHMLEEAAKRDHRKIGPAIGLFHLQDCAPGQVFWHHKGWKLYRTLENYMREKCFENNYIEVNTPQVMDVEIWKTSGHWDKFRDDMMTQEDGDRTFGLKPMSCPGNIQIFNQGIVSYRDLPMRMAEFGRVFRNEASGAVHGIMRVKAFTQDDAHSFCTLEQMDDEILDMVTLIREVYEDFGFGDFRVKFSDRPEKRLGTDDIWDTAETALKLACKKAELDYTINPGEGAFYGPKLEFVLKDCLGRDWQCGTIQLDLNMPERFDMNYVADDGEKRRPIMIHRAILGSLERFTGILIENFAGHFPLWLAPEQVVVMGVSSKQDDAVKAFAKRLSAEGFSVKTDLRNEKVSYKIREHNVSKIPVQIVLGDREIQNDTATIRRLGSPDQTTLTTEELIAQLHTEIKEKHLPKISE